MVPVMSLWAPIILSAVAVFVVSSIVHMVLPLHRNDLRKVPGENELLETLRRLNVPPGDYGAPYAGSPKAMKDPVFVEKMTKGPVVFMTVAPGRKGMGRNLIFWFVYTIVVGLFAAYLTSRAVGPAASSLQVFRFIATSAFMGYALALLQQSIWYNRKWGTTIRSMIDGLTYAIVTGVIFGWLWPR